MMMWDNIHVSDRLKWLEYEFATVAGTDTVTGAESE